MSLSSTAISHQKRSDTRKSHFLRAVAEKIIDEFFSILLGKGYGFQPTGITRETTGSSAGEGAVVDPLLADLVVNNPGGVPRRRAALARFPEVVFRASSSRSLERLDGVVVGLAWHSPACLGRLQCEWAVVSGRSEARQSATTRV